MGLQLVSVVLLMGLCLWFFIFLDLAQGALVGHVVILFDPHCGLVVFINCFIGYVGFLIIIGRSLDFLLIVYSSFVVVSITLVLSVLVYAASGVSVVSPSLKSSCS